MPRSVLGRLGIRIMSINPENIFGRGIFGREEKTPKPKGGEPPEDDDLPPPEQTEESKEIEEKALTKEAQKEYPKELEEIADLAKDNFEIIAMSPDYKQISTQFKHPDTLFLPNNFLENYRQTRKFLSKNDIHQGMKIKILELAQRFKKPKREIYQKFNEQGDNFEKLKNEIEIDKEKLIKKSTNLVFMDKDIANIIAQRLNEGSEGTLSEAKIKEQSVKHSILNILYCGPKESHVIGISQLENFRKENLRNKKKISPTDYQKHFLDMTAPILRAILNDFPSLNEETVENFGKEWLKKAEQIGGEYLKHEEKEKKHDVGIYR